jgi:hypothetical protein
MIKALSRLIFIIMVLLTTGCIKETYDMNMLSKKAHLSPTWAVSAIYGDISLSDIVESSDTVVFDPDNFVRLIFKKDSVIELKLTDFTSVKSIIGYNETDIMFPDLQLRNPDFDPSKGILAQLVANIEPDSIDLEIEDVLNHITGDVHINNPILRFNYINSFLDPIEITLYATGKRTDATVDLDLDPFTLSHPADIIEHQVSDTYVIDKNNSSLPELVSMLPEKILFSGSALLEVPDVKSMNDDPVIDSDNLIGSIEIEVPLEFSLSDFQFTDTVDNFLADAFDDESEFNWDDFELFRVDFDVKNGFPMGASVTMDLYDSLNLQVISSVDATDILEPAPVDSNGKASGVSESSTRIEFTKEFFSSINTADAIIFRFTLITTGNGSKDVKIYSDYRIDFKTSLVLKPDIGLK